MDEPVLNNNVIKIPSDSYIEAITEKTKCLNQIEDIREKEKTRKQIDRACKDLPEEEKPQAILNEIDKIYGNILNNQCKQLKGLIKNGSRRVITSKKSKIMDE